MPAAATRARTGRAAPLLAWFDRHRRALPWRTDRDPYRIWLAEVLLQQTRVAQAEPYYRRLVARYPTVEALAAAPLEEVRKLWEGAGYYRRAENLWRAAGEIVRARRGAFPRSAEELARLPGVGPYIAAAVASLAFDQPVVALDANAIRVAARWAGEGGDPRSSKLRARLSGLLRAELPLDRPGAFNEAIMELGETICTPRAPRCPACPVRGSCVAGRTLVDPGALPRRSPRGARPHHVGAIVVLERGGRWLVQQRPAGGLLGGLWEFPGGHLEPSERPEAAARRELLEETGWTAGPLEDLGTVRHAYSHFSVELHVFRGPAGARRRAAPRRPAARWVTPTEFEALPRPMATRKAAARAGRADPAGAFPDSGSRGDRASP